MMRSKKIVFIRLFLFFISLFIAAKSIEAVTFSGRVLDINNQPIQGATVGVNKVVGTVTNNCNGAHSNCGSSVSNSSGYWSVSCNAIEETATGIKVYEANNSNYDDSTKSAEPGQYSWGVNAVCLPAPTGGALRERGYSPINFYDKQKPTNTPTPSPSPTSPPVTNTPIPGCDCRPDNTCNTPCQFSFLTPTPGTSAINYTIPLRCSHDVAATAPTLAQADKNSYCTRNRRGVGDADGNDIVDFDDYVYLLRAKYGQPIPSSVNPDFNGDGIFETNDFSIFYRTAFAEARLR